ncbi:MAG: D-alanyl-D-alanine carboxypeptidase [Acetatifactor sp.]|nr:D-alanyl-D-alanine carboxypeptidase [Acetatifactor sp.]
MKGKSGKTKLHISLYRVKRSQRRWAALILGLWFALLQFVRIDIPVQAQVEISAPSAILMEASTGQVLFELNATERRCPASITKIMTLLLTFEQIEAGKVRLEEDVITSEYASSMGGSQVFLAQGEVQSLDTMIKCITVASGNDASVAVAEHIAGSEEAFVNMMNEKAQQLGMTDTHFEDCCGLTNSDEHYTTARDVALMSRELITKYPQVYNYTQIWMEDITHQTRQGTTNFTLSSTNKLLKQYPYATGLKTGSTEKAKYCLAATARKDGIDMIAVIMGAPDPKERFKDAQTLLTYGFNISAMYVDPNTEPLPGLKVERGVAEQVPLVYAGEFRYLDTGGRDLSKVEKVIDLPEAAPAPVEQGMQAGESREMLYFGVLGSVPLLYGESVAKAKYRDYLYRIFYEFLL